MREKRTFADLFFGGGPNGDLNPCYRLERLARRLIDAAG